MERNGDNNDHHRLFSRRLAVLGAGKSALIAALVGRMYYLQVVEADTYRALAEKNRVNLQLLPPPRGRIVDRFGIAMADNRQNFRVLIVREQVMNLAETLDRLSRLTNFKDADRVRVYREMLLRRPFVPVTVCDDLTWEDIARIQINAPDLPGVSVDEGSTRYYPLGAAAAHVVGYVAPVSKEDLAVNKKPLLELPGFQIGKAGLEKQFDQSLRGKAGYSQIEVNAVGRVRRELSRTRGQAGADLRLTIDARLQRCAVRAMGDAVGTVAIMDVRSGDVLAMVSHPTYDPNSFSRGLDTRQWQALAKNQKSPLSNRQIAGQYAPGSTFKAIVALAALEAGVIAPDQTVFCSGHISLGGRKFHCWKRGGHGPQNMLDAIANSCDVYFYELGRRLGPDRIAAMARRFGFGQPTGIELPGEKDGLVPSRAWKQATLGEPWSYGESLNMAIGQGYLLATPLQMLLMTARIANGGLAVKPRLVLGTSEAGGGPSTLASLGVTNAHLALVQRGMLESVLRGTGRRARLPEATGILVAGKSGTAQVRRITLAERRTGIVKNEDLPWEQRDHALFVCYVPAHSPRYAVAVMLEHGGSGATLVAREVMMGLLPRYLS